MSIYDVEGNRVFPEYEDATTGTQIHFNVTINPNKPVNEWVDATGTLNVNAVLILPSTYTPDGEPTKLIFMHHGASGTVTDTTWYSEVQSWPNFYNGYLNAGFAVYDVNGCGPYSAEDEAYHRDYGCPNGVLAAHAAYEYIIKNYNIDKRIFVHGSSMGGAIAISFPKAFANIVRAVGLFSPAELRGAAIDTYTYCDEVASNFGYADQAAAAADNYEEFWASALTMEHYNSSGERQFHPFDYDWRNDDTETHVARFPVPAKFWHGTADTNTSPLFSQKAVNALRLGGCMAFYRPVSGGTHNICTGSNSTVINEAVLWFKRFA